MLVHKYNGKDIVSGLTKFTKKVGLPEPKNWHLPKHKYTGQSRPI